MAGSRASVASDRCGRELVMQTVLSKSKSLAVVAAGILVAAILLLMTASAQAVVPEEHAASAPNDGPPHE